MKEVVYYEEIFIWYFGKRHGFVLVCSPQFCHRDRTPCSTATLSTEEYGVIRYTELIAPTYEDGLWFTEGLAAVKKDGKWGYIDMDGEVVIDFIYDDAGVFSEGYAVVGTRSVSEYDYDISTYGMIDKEGNYTQIQRYNSYDDRHYDCVYEFEWMSDVFPDIAAGLDGNCVSSDMIFHNGYLRLKTGWQVNIIDTTGYSVSPFSFWVTDVAPYNEGYWVGGNNWEGMPLMIANGNGDTIYDFYESNSSWGDNPDAWYFGYFPLAVNQGLLPVQVGSEYLWGVMDVSTMTWVIDPIYAGFNFYMAHTTQQLFGSTGTAMMLNVEGKMGAVDKSGNTVIPFLYDNLYSSANHLILAELNGKWGYLDQYGAEVIPMIYDKASSFGYTGLAVVVKDGKASIIDTKGEEVEGADLVHTSAYFSTEPDGSVGVIYSPDEIVTIQENGLVGYGKIEYKPMLPTAEDMSSWAVNLVVEAIEEDLVPVSLQTMYESNITRGDFATLAMTALCTMLDCTLEELVEEKTGKTLADCVAEYPFVDTTKNSVIAAYALGIVAGKQNNKFDSFAEITRQEAAVMLQNLAKVAGVESGTISSVEVADKGDIATWASASVDYVSELGIMSTTGGNKFSPNGSYSREQSFVTVLNILKML